MLESTVAHEVGHQWFYNGVGNDQHTEPWLDEAVDQYVTGLYFLDQYGPSGQQSYRDSWVSRWERIKRAPIPIGHPASSYQGKEYGAIVYGEITWAVIHRSAGAAAGADGVRSISCGITINHTSGASVRRSRLGADGRTALPVRS